MPKDRKEGSRPSWIEIEEKDVFVVSKSGDSGYRTGDSGPEGPEYPGIYPEFPVSGTLVRILRSYTRILRTLWAGVSGDIPGVSGLDLYQHIFFFPFLSSLVLIFVIYLGW